MTMTAPRESAEIFAFVPRKDAAAVRAHSVGTRRGSDAVVDLMPRLPVKIALPRMDFGDAWYHAEAIQEVDRTRPV